MAVCDGGMAKGLHVMKNGCGGYLVPGMVMVICAGWLLGRKWAVYKYAIIIDDGASCFGLRFDLCLPVSGLPTDKHYIKLRQHFVYYIHSFQSSS